jgi:inner membrane protein
MINPIDYIGWTATAVFGCSYLFRKPATLRRIQALAALMWVAYGLLISAMPVVVANVIVATAAVWSSFARSRSAPVEGT